MEVISNILHCYYYTLLHFLVNINITVLLYYTFCLASWTGVGNVFRTKSFSTTAAVLGRLPVPLPGTKFTSPLRDLTSAHWVAIGRLSWFRVCPRSRQVLPQIDQNPPATLPRLPLVLGMHLQTCDQSIELYAATFSKLKNITRGSNKCTYRLVKCVYAAFPQVVLEIHDRLLIRLLGNFCGLVRHNFVLLRHRRYESCHLFACKNA